MVIVLAGTIGRSGLGGQAWASLQYLLGFRELGHEVYYLEDCGDTSYAWNWESEEWDYELDYPARYVSQCLGPFGLGDRWCYRTNHDSRGMTLSALREVCSQTDLLILRASPLWVWRPEYDAPKRRAFIDVDPGFTQIALAQGDAGLAEGVARCECRFSYGQNIGLRDCPIPDIGGPWHPTLPPVALDAWPAAEGVGEDFTSIVRWQGFRDVTYLGVSYGQRDREFPRYVDLPGQTGQSFRLARMGADPEALRGHGWKLVRGEAASRTPESYRTFIQGSRAELCVPKHGYVAMGGGWFSDRSVCYLASGRPVLMGDTGLHGRFGSRGGLVVFRDLPSAVDGVRRINSDYERHRQAAREIAEAYFACREVLPKFLDRAMER